MGLGPHWVEHGLVFVLGGLALMALHLDHALLDSEIVNF
jgi:hypothetical protein